MRIVGDLVAFALQALAKQLAMTADRLGFLAGFLFRRLFVRSAQFHLAKHAFALHLLLQRLEGLVDIVVAYNYLNDRPISQ